MLAFVLPADNTVAYYWRWSDGSRARERTFTEPRSGPAELPRLVVSSQPPGAGHRVVLEFRADGRWHPEDATRTGDDGTARLELNPYCSDGAWCDMTLDYRLVIDGQVARIRVTFDG